MDILAIVLVLWLVTAMLYRNDDDDDHWNGGSPQIIVMPRRCRMRRA